MMRRMAAAAAVLVGALVGGCGGGGSDGGGGDKTACQALKDVGGGNPDPNIYPDLLRMDLSAELRTALTELRDSTAVGEVREDAFAKAGRVAASAGRAAALCAEEGVTLSG